MDGLTLAAFIVLVVLVLIVRRHDQRAQQRAIADHEEFCAEVRLFEMRRRLDQVGDDVDRDVFPRERVA